MTSTTPLGNLGKLERRLTPLRLALHLVNEVRDRHKTVVVAALFVDELGPYVTIPGVEAWTATVDATRYAGPWPIIAHPACGPWGQLRAFSKYQDAAHGELAMYLVHDFGGVVEQPSTSALFKTFGHPPGRTQRINQSDFGHRAQKPTTLYWVD